MGLDAANAALHVGVIYSPSVRRDGGCRAREDGPEERVQHAAHTPRTISAKPVHPGTNDVDAVADEHEQVGREVLHQQRQP